ncbi:nitroreductase family protein [Bacillus sp. 2205SS5-2]|uniref:nitroreductase family protein n=1 Tax=Bacillus sp. 2205SS5-2 TaxID=3109031 RepID=UPI0030067672
MSTLQKAIRERRTIRKFTNENIETEEVLQLLEDAVYAPNHQLREPWSFILIRDDAKPHFMNEIKNSYERLEVFRDYSQEVIDKKQQQLKQFIETCPVHLIVMMKQDSSQKVWEEDFAATCALIQNLQLLGWSNEMGMVWKTNPYIYDPAFSAAMNIPQNQKIVGVIHIGKPAHIPKEKVRKSPRHVMEIRSE